MLAVVTCLLHVGHLAMGLDLWDLTPTRRTQGFVPAFLKLAPYTTISLILTDKLSQQLLGKSAL